MAFKNQKSKNNRFKKEDKFEFFNRKNSSSQSKHTKSKSRSNSRFSDIQNFGRSVKAKTFNKLKSFEDSFEPSYIKYEYGESNVAKQQEKESYIEEREDILAGRNPIKEAIKSGRDIEKLWVQKGQMTGSASEIIAKLKAQKIPVQEVEKARLDATAKHHQGLIAFVSAYNYCTPDDILNKAKSLNQDPFIVIADGITDPHNLGAIIRSAECAGAHGVIIPSRRSAGLTSTAVKASAGAVEHILVARVGNLVACIEELKEQNVWIYGTTMDAQNYTEVDYTGAVALVIGSEGEGMSKLVHKNCDKLVSIPLKGKIDSLNASVACGILLFEIAKNR